MRDKLIELIDKARRDAATKCHSFMACKECEHSIGDNPRCRNAYIAESLIANGVTIRPKGEWVINPDREDEFEHHMCSECKTNAHFQYIYIDDYDEGMDGEWECIGQRIDDIEEYLSNFCPNCGANMRNI